MHLLLLIYKINHTVTGINSEGQLEYYISLYYFLSENNIPLMYGFSGPNYE